MIVMAMGHGLLLMAGLFAVLLSERMPGPNPASRVGRPSQVLATVALAVLSVVSPG
jgi:hypothetical protein